jgi:pimeloyl-ACP methyl ester carboxylesterase
VKPFTAAVADSEITDLQERLARTRWTDQLRGTTWEYGTPTSYLRELCAYWADDFDWRPTEAKFNAWPQFITEIDGLRIHVIHARSPHPGALPIMLTHGWPGSSVEFLDVIGPLVDPPADGGDAADAFHVVVASLPGYGFSGPTTKRGVHGKPIAAAWVRIMADLGYDRYVAQGGDIGAAVSAYMGELAPERVAAILLNLLPVGPADPQDPLAGLTGDDLVRAQATFDFLADDAGYWRIQETRPMNLAHAMNDSPAGLAGWIVEKFRAWTDCRGDVESAFSKDELLANISLYWFTQTYGSSARFYFEATGPGRIQPMAVTDVPCGYADFPGEHFKMPRAYADRTLNIVSWQKMPKGGHFPALQVPDLYVGEIRRFFRDYR